MREDAYIIYRLSPSFGATSTGPANDNGDFFLVFQLAVLHVLKPTYIESYNLTNDYVNTMIDE